MITGHNTDTQHAGVVYHVQTEDGGKDNPVVVTLVYRGGRILASKKTGYTDILGAPDLANQVRALLDKQHRLMLTAVNAGLLAEGGKLEAKAAESLRRDGFAPPAEPGPSRTPSPPVPAAQAPGPVTPTVARPSSASGAPVPPVPSLVEGSPAPAGSKAATHDEKSLDQVILEFLASELGKK
jgi:hypothetical protein